MNFNTSFILIGWKTSKLGAFEYLQMDCNGSSHIVGLVMSNSLINYV